MYGGTNRACRLFFMDMGITYSFVDFRDPKNVEAAISRTPSSIFSESPANPTLTLTDLEAVSKLAKRARHPPRVRLDLRDAHHPASRSS